MKSSEYQTDSRMVAALQDLAGQVRRDARLAKQARSDFAKSTRAFFGPLLRAIGDVGLIALIVLMEIGRQQQPTE